MNFFKLFLCAFLGLSSTLQAQGLLQRAQQGGEARFVEGMVRVGQLQAGVVTERSAVAAGQPIWVGLRLVHDPHWHTYWRNPGDSGLPTRIEWRLPQGWQVGEIQWPTPKRLPVGPLANFGYEGELLLAVELRPPAVLSGTEVTLQAHGHWLVCKDVCIPGDAQLALRLPIAPDAKTIRNGTDSQLFAAARQSWPKKDAARVVTAHVNEKTLSLFWPAGGTQESSGFFYPYLEGLILPAAAQSLSKTAQGWRLDVPLGESASSALAEIKKKKTVEGIWVVGDQSGLEWVAPLSAQPPPAIESVVNAGQTAAQAAPSVPSTPSRELLWSAIGAAILGGLMLNLMPCVFPVIGLKVLSFAESAHSTSVTVWRSLSFSLGVLLSFLALGGLLVALRSAGDVMGWGFQLQSPPVVLTLALLFVLIAINLFGVFEMGLLAVRAANAGFAERAASRSGAGGAFFSGVLAVVVASPCTAPFMGSAIGFTANAGIAETLTVFAALGVGMSLPYLILALSPGLLRALPRPGPWMVGFKQFMAFPMLAAAAWLFWVLATLQGADSVLPALLTAVALAGGLWIYGRFIQRGGIGAISILGLAVMLAVLGAAFVSVLRIQPPTSDQKSAQSAAPNQATVWQPWSAGLPERLAAEGSIVFVDFTASWCITCQANKVRVLQSELVTKAFTEKRVSTLRADWTRQDPVIAAELKRHGRNGVPLYLVYRPGDTKPRVLSEWLTEQEVLTALR